MKMFKPERFMESGGMKLGVSSANLVLWESLGSIPSDE